MSTFDMAVAAQARRVDEEIDKQIRLLCDLQTQRNSFLLISRLPTETLAAIFICSARDYHSTQRGYPTRTAPGWVNVSYVCRHWRNVALNCPTLWSYLFFTSRRWTEELLARSKQASLKLYATVHPLDANHAGLCFVGQVMNFHMERIQELHLDLPYMHTEKPSLPSLSHLRKLQISVSFPALFNGDTPALRTLKLSCCPVPWYSLKLNGLTTLDLRLVPSKFQQNMVEFLATLSSMQDLTHLYLHHAIASAAGFLSSAVFPYFPENQFTSSFSPFDRCSTSTVIALLACVNIPIEN
ncbi:hypothetical protein EV363DRAFT_554031 [Boletus edulis]|nr:hypothetical protein EV363DRAFT_554031 [Boletus edulis]